jgi:hypothetical protein
LDPRRGWLRAADTDNIELMLRFVRILLAMIATAVVVGAVRNALHLGPEFLGGGFPGELADLGLWWLVS